MRTSVQPETAAQGVPSLRDGQACTPPRSGGPPKGGLSDSARRGELPHSARRADVPELPIDPPDLPILAPDDEQAVEAWIKHDGDLAKIAQALEVHICEAVRRLSSRVVRAYTNAADEVRDAALRRQALEKLRKKMNNPEQPEEERRAAAAIVRATSHAAYRASPRSTRSAGRVAGDPRDGEPIRETSPHQRTCSCNGCGCSEEQRAEACEHCDCGYWDDPEVCDVDDGPGEEPSSAGFAPPLRAVSPAEGAGERGLGQAEAPEGRGSVAPGEARGCGCSENSGAPAGRRCCDAPCGELRREAG